MYVEYDFLNEQVVKLEAEKSRTFLSFDLSLHKGKEVEKLEKQNSKRSGLGVY